MPDLKPIRFVKAHTLYNSGEVAGFPEAEAQDLVDRGIAVAYVAPGAEPVVDDSADVTAEEFEKQLNAMTKAELVLHAKEDFDLDLSENQKKDELVAAIKAAAEKAGE